MFIARDALAFQAPLGVRNIEFSAVFDLLNGLQGMWATWKRSVWSPPTAY